MYVYFLLNFKKNYIRFKEFISRMNVYYELVCVELIVTTTYYYDLWLNNIFPSGFYTMQYVFFKLFLS